MYPSHFLFKLKVANLFSSICSRVEKINQEIKEHLICKGRKSKRVSEYYYRCIACLLACNHHLRDDAPSSSHTLKTVPTAQLLRPSILTTNLYTSIFYLTQPNPLLQLTIRQSLRNLALRLSAAIRLTRR